MSSSQRKQIMPKKAATGQSTLSLSTSKHVGKKPAGLGSSSSQRTLNLPKKPMHSGSKVAPTPVVISANLKGVSTKKMDMSSTGRKYRTDALNASTGSRYSRGDGMNSSTGSRADELNQSNLPSSPTERLQARALASSRRPAEPKPSALESALVRLGKRVKAYIWRPKVTLKSPTAQKMVRALGLRQSDLRTLRLRFDLLDVDGSGEIDETEFYEAVGETKSPITEEVFRLMDLDESNTLCFDEYVQVALAYCMYTKDDVLKLCFDLFDKDRSGAIDEREFTFLCQAVNNGDPLFAGNFQNALDAIDVNDDGLIDFDEFKELDKRYPLVFYPAFRMQDRLQKATLGEQRWLQVMENVAFHMRAQSKGLHQRQKDARHPAAKLAAAVDNLKELTMHKLGFLDYLAHPPVDLAFLASQAPVTRDDSTTSPDDSAAD